jgi:hypothetical protein
VHGPPRRTESKIQRKKRAKSVESEEQRNLRHAEAFRDLETPVRELYLMGEIASDIPAEARRPERAKQQHPKRS